MVEEDRDALEEFKRVLRDKVRRIEEYEAKLKLE